MRLYYVQFNGHHGYSVIYYVYINYERTSFLRFYACVGREENNLKCILVLYDLNVPVILQSVHPLYHRNSLFFQ